MKKLITTICLLGLMVLLISGCGRSGQDGGVIYDGVPEGTCAEESILSMLKNDDSPEFVLDKHYYSLPVNVNEFIGRTWELTIDEYDGQEVILQPKERIDGTLSKNGNSISVTLANNSDLPLDAKECDVIRVYVYVAEGEMEPNYFVTKCGITTATPAKTVKAQLKDMDGYKEQSDMYYLVSDGDMGSRDILYFSNNSGYTSIKISSAEDWAYSMYKPSEQKAEEQTDNIAVYKADAEKNCPSDYNQIVEELESSDSLRTVPFYSIEGTIIAKTTGNYEGMEDNIIYGQDLSLYAVQDKSGQVYCIFEGFVDTEVLKLPELAEGDVISVWGFASKVTTFEDGYKAPTIITKIVEKDGEIIFLADDLKVD